MGQPVAIKNMIKMRNSKHVTVSVLIGLIRLTMFFRKRHRMLQHVRPSTQRPHVPCVTTHRTLDNILFPVPVTCASSLPEAARRISGLRRHHLRHVRRCDDVMLCAQLTESGKIGTIYVYTVSQKDRKKRRQNFC